MSRIPVFGWFLLLPGLALADASLSAPVTGYVADSSAPALRAVLGVPGSLLFSDPLALPDGTTGVRVAPGRDFAWAERGTAPPAVLFLNGVSVARFSPVEGALPAADWVAFSPGAASMVLFSASAGRLQVVSGLPDAPAVAWDLDAGSLPDQPLAAAVSDDGSTLLTASESAVYLLNPGAAAQLLLSGQKIHSLAMMPNGTDVVAADSAAGSVFLLPNVLSAPAARALASNLNGVEYISAAWDGSMVLLAQPGAQAVSILDPVSGAFQSFPVDVAPASLQPMRNPDVFLISSQPGEPGWIFVRTGSAGTSLFIPPAQPAANAQPSGGQQ